MRSKGKIDVSLFAQDYDGGGHFNAAGGVTKKLSDIDAIIEKFHAFL